MRIFASLAAVALGACGAFSAGDSSEPKVSDAGAADAEDVATSHIPDAAGPNDEAAAEDGDVPDVSGGVNRVLLQVHAPTKAELGAGPSYSISFPSPTATSSVPMIAIAAKATTLDLPSTPVSASANWVAVTSSKNHVATAVFLGPQGKSVSQVDFSFPQAPTDLVVLLMEWAFSSERYSPAWGSADAASQVTFSAMAADGAQVAKQPVIIDIAGVLSNSLSSSPGNGFMAVSPPLGRGSISLVAAYYLAQDTQPHAATYALSSASDYDQIAMIFNVKP